LRAVACWLVARFSRIKPAQVNANMDLTLVLSFGRAGSTALLHGMSLHPQVLLWREHPFENRIAQYVYAAARAGGPPADFSPIRFDLVAARDEDEVILQALRSIPREEFSLSPRDVVDRVYERIREHYGSPRRQHIVEKGLGLPLPFDVVAAWPDVRLVLLSRDPRSVFFSVKAFNRRRGFLGFGEAKGDPALFNSIVDFTITMHREGRVRPNALEIRYESLIEDPRTTKTPVFSHCGLGDMDLDGVLQGLATHDEKALSHMTTSPERSIDRWRADAADPDLSLFASRASDLIELGYR
jgi:hypothetical protein